VGDPELTEEELTRIARRVDEIHGEEAALRRPTPLPFRTMLTLTGPPETDFTSNKVMIPLSEYLEEGEEAVRLSLRHEVGHRTAYGLPHNKVTAMTIKLLAYTYLHRALTKRGMTFKDEEVANTAADLANILADLVIDYQAEALDHLPIDVDATLATYDAGKEGSGQHFYALLAEKVFGRPLLKDGGLTLLHDLDPDLDHLAKEVAFSARIIARKQRITYREDWEKISRTLEKMADLAVKWITLERRVVEERRKQAQQKSGGQGQGQGQSQEQGQGQGHGQGGGGGEAQGSGGEKGHGNQGGVDKSGGKTPGQGAADSNRGGSGLGQGNPPTGGAQGGATQDKGDEGRGESVDNGQAGSPSADHEKSGRQGGGDVSTSAGGRESGGGGGVVSQPAPSGQGGGKGVNGGTADGEVGAGNGSPGTGLQATSNGSTRATPKGGAVRVAVAPRPPGKTLWPTGVTGESGAGDHCVVNVAFGGDTKDLVETLSLLPKDAQRALLEGKAIEALFSETVGSTLERQLAELVFGRLSLIRSAFWQSERGFTVSDLSEGEPVTVRMSVPWDFRSRNLDPESLAENPYDPRSWRMVEERRVASTRGSDRASGFRRVIVVVDSSFSTSDKVSSKDSDFYTVLDYICMAAASVVAYARRASLPVTVIAFADKASEIHRGARTGAGENYLEILKKLSAIKYGKNTHYGEALSLLETMPKWKKDKSLVVFISDGEPTDIPPKEAVTRIIDFARTSGSRFAYVLVAPAGKSVPIMKDPRFLNNPYVDVAKVEPTRLGEFVFKWLLHRGRQRAPSLAKRGTGYAENAQSKANSYGKSVGGRV